MERKLVHCILRIILLSALAVLSTFYPYAFDRAATQEQYPFQIANGFGLWSWFAYISNNAGFDFNFFYFCMALLFWYVSFQYLKYVSKNIGIPSAILFAFYLMVWFGLGQMRWGTAIVLVALAFQVQQYAKGYLCSIAAFAIHFSALPGLFLILIKNYLKQIKYFKTLVLSIAAVTILFISKINLYDYLPIIGYEDYSNWQELEKTSTIYKLIPLLIVTLIKKNSTVKNMQLLLLAFAAPFCLEVVTAGRVFQFLLVVFPSVGNLVKSQRIVWFCLIFWEVQGLLRSQYDSVL